MCSLILCGEKFLDGKLDGNMRFVSFLNRMIEREGWGGIQIQYVRAYVRRIRNHDVSLVSNGFVESHKFLSIVI